VKVFIIAGEASGDKLGAELMKGLQHLVGKQVQFAGLGGSGMIGQGLTSLFPMDQISIMGIGEILMQYHALKRRIQQTVEAVLQFQPDVLITIDLPEFNLRVAQSQSTQFYSHSALCGPNGLGMATEAGGKNGPLYRSGAGAVSV
jgi:lipid-A-disaccharide synthase